MKLEDSSFSFLELANWHLTLAEIPEFSCYYNRDILELIKDFVGNLKKSYKDDKKLSAVAKMIKK